MNVACRLIFFICYVLTDEYEVIYDGAYPAAVGFLTAWAVIFFQRFDQLIALKLAGWESFDIHISFDPAVVLLTFPMGMVEVNNAPVWQRQVCPPCI